MPSRYGPAARMLTGRAQTTTYPPAHALGAGTRLRNVEAALARLPVAVWLSVMVAVSALFRFSVARSSGTPWILPDEYIYSQLGRSFASTGHFVVNGQSFAAGSYGPLYAILIAPIWRLTESGTTAYALVQALNCLLMSSAAVFVYLLARRVLDRGGSLFAALLSLLVPSMIYTSKAMTENIAYPLFLAAMLAIVLMLERPSTGRQLAALALIALAVLARAQMVVLLPALATAIMLTVLLVPSERTDRSKGRLHGLVAFRLTGLALIAASVAAAAWWLARGGGLLGEHASLATRFELGDIPRWLLSYLGELDLYLGTIPLAAFALLVVLALGGDRLPREARIFTFASLAAAFWLVVLAAAYSTQPRPTPHLLDRYVFYLAPLALIAMFLWIRLGLPRRRATLAIAVCVFLLPAAVPYGDLFDARVWPMGVSASTVGLVPWAQLEPVLGTHAELLAVLLGLSGIAALAFLLVSHAHAYVVRLIVVANFMLVTLFALSANMAVAEKAHLDYIARDAGWIDHAVPKSDRVIGIWSGKSPRGADTWAALLENQLNNRRLATIYAFGSAYGLISRTQVFARAASATQTGVLMENGLPIKAQWVVTDSGLPLDGSVVARDPQSGLMLVRVDGSAPTLRLSGSG